MIGVELVRDRATKEPASTERDEIVQTCFRRGSAAAGLRRQHAPLLSAAGCHARSNATWRSRILDEVLRKWRLGNHVR